MENIQVLIKYDGLWDDTGNYNNYKATGMLLPCDSNYNGLCQNLKKFMNLNDNIMNFHISYKMQDNCPPLKIATDWNLAFYIDLKKTVANAMEYPLCVDIVQPIQSSHPQYGYWDIAPVIIPRQHEDVLSVRFLFVNLCVRLCTYVYLRELM